jgi:hypothetical protein
MRVSARSTNSPAKPLAPLPAPLQPQASFSPFSWSAVGLVVLSQ